MRQADSKRVKDLGAISSGEPLRDEILSPARIANHGREIAKAQRWAVGRANPLTTLTDRAASSLEADHAELSRAVLGGQVASPAGEWLLDNHYLIDEQIIQIRRDLPKKYGTELPRLLDGPYRDCPRIFEAILSLIAHTDSQLNERVIVRFVSGYQTESPLTIGEVWAIPIMLRIGLVENLRRLARSTVLNQRAEAAAGSWAERLVFSAQDDPAHLPELLARLDAFSRKQPPAFYLHLAQRLGELETGGESVNAWLEGRLSVEGIALTTTSVELQQSRAADQISIANAITSIRFLNAYDWHFFFERVSVVEQILRTDPAHVYGSMDFESRDRYRRALESMARRCDLSEWALARAAIDRASAALAEDPVDETRGHVGWYLISGGRFEFERAVEYRPLLRELLYRGPLRRRGLFYWGMLLSIEVGLLIVLALYARWAGGTSSWAIGVLLAIGLVPVSDMSMTIANRTSAFFYPPRLLPKLEHSKPVGIAHRTLVVYPLLPQSPEDVARVTENMEVAYLCNQDPDIGFCLLLDAGPSETESTPLDEQITRAALDTIREMNYAHPSEGTFPPFHVLARRRVYNEADGVWMGWERKRGMLTELVREMRGEPETTFVDRAGEVEFRRTCTFLLTLDADTLLPRDAAKRLIATIAHPLNRARLEPGDTRVRHGYGLVQPRVSISIESSARSLYARLNSGNPGLDPYAHAISDTYQDVFGEGSFTGKGIFEVDVYNAILADRFPDYSLLSHDLIEGSFLRTALACDIEVYDDCPRSYQAASKRSHRWIRGDWQTLPYLGPTIPDAHGNRTPNPLSLLHRWKIVDNLRRSLVAPLSLALIIFGWPLFSQDALTWPLAPLFIVMFPATFMILDSVLSKLPQIHLRALFGGVAKDVAQDFFRIVFDLSTLPHRAVSDTDAMVRAVWRRFVSHRNLLEWQTADAAEKAAKADLRAYWSFMGWPTAGAVAAVVLMCAVDPIRLAVAGPLSLLWLSGPTVAQRFSLPRKERFEVLRDPQRLELRRLARQTWRFFDHYTCDEGNQLPPDNYQEYPGGVVAWRTSPTNIGLGLLAFLSAWDLGYLTVEGLERRCAATLRTLRRLERLHGHFFNWYDIRTLEPLRPTYVSTVDSGNLVGHLIVLSAGLLEASEAPLLGPQLIEGARDSARTALEDLVARERSLGPSEVVLRTRETLDALERALSLAEPPDDLGGWHALLTRTSELAERVAGASAGIVARDTADQASAADAAHVRSAIGDALGEISAHEALLNAFAPWADMLADAPAELLTRPRLSPLFANTPSLAGLAEGLHGALEELDSVAASEQTSAAWAVELASGIRESRPGALKLLERIRSSASDARRICSETSFRWLYDSNRRLFSIGFNTAEGRRDASYYDLLASECRLASFLAIANGEVSQEHWFRLGRALTRTPDGRALVSWSASMFEYLMPSLIMRSWKGTLLQETYETIVARQISYGAERGVPWGVSESAFYAKDASGTYQYQAFGVPGLGLKRGLSEDVVVAPYASALALTLHPSAVAQNFLALEKAGANGRYGFYESLDFTPGRAPAGKSRGVVKAYFAHHQGMILVSITNALTGSTMQERFHSDPSIAATSLLLQERVPRGVETVSPHVTEVSLVRSIHELPPPAARTYTTADTYVPATHFLSNGRYSVMLTSGGGGYSKWNGLSVNRYREDVTRDCWGMFFYIRDLDTGEIFTATHNPWPKEPESYRVVFAPDKAEFRRRDGSLQTVLEVVVSPEDDVEIRRLAFSNRGRKARRLEVTSYMEVAFTDAAADQAHKSFSNLFVETEALPRTSSVLFTRRPRSSEEERFWGFHMTTGTSVDHPYSFETDRGVVLGRLRGVDDPAVMDTPGSLGGSKGAVLDPCCCLRCEVVVPPGETERIVFATGCSERRDAAIHLTEKYRDPMAAIRAMDLARTASQLELRDLGLTPKQAETIERLASRLLLTDPYSPLKVKTPAENGLPMSGLWAIGISGDHPILLVRVDDPSHAPLVRQALLAHQYWRHKGLTADLVILNTRPTGYTDELEDRLRLLVRTGHGLQLLDRPGGVFLRRSDLMHPDTLTLLLSVARATLDGSAGSIELQLNRRGKRPVDPEPFVRTREPEPYPAPERDIPDLRYFNGLGGFDAATNEYVMVLDHDHVAPSTWINVLANPTFGATVSETGVGCTWAMNSHENRLTTWNNDPVSDGTGEALFVRDEETGEYWSPTPMPAGSEDPFVVRHGHGSVRFSHTTHGIAHELDWFVAPDAPVRVCRLKLENLSDRARTLSVTQFVEWVLGDSRSRTQQLVATWYDVEFETLTAHNHYSLEFPGRCAFLACDRPLHSWTASRSEFIGRNGRHSRPAAMRHERLCSASGRFHDNCGALMTRLTIEPGETQEVTFLLGQTDTLDQCREVVKRFRTPGASDRTLTAAKAFWSDLLGTIQVDTPDDRLDLMMNGWLLYQTTACRLWGRTATYQSGGAFGFRDQLQDVLALMHVRPALVREQIIEASRHQFTEGDVLHWWQPFSGRGVRTRISDDRHWLPLVVAEYAAATGDDSILVERVPFITANDVGDEESIYIQPAISEVSASIYEHCVAAIEIGRPVGAHGLPLMGGGDWNDGMNRVGIGGAGESVWLAWFLALVLERFAPVCERMGEPDRAADYREWAQSLAAAVEANAWDGAWYRRAYFDDGTPLGTREGLECRIDAIAQAWAVISGKGDLDRCEVALESVDEKLVRNEYGLIALLSPPFDRMEQDPGYIKGYVPGVRENGGQYTHAATWVAQARLMLGDGDRGTALLDMINPISHALDLDSAERYRVEPYVIAADVYAVDPHIGRGGWTWYTGSAGLFHRVALNHLLGFRIETHAGERRIVVDPCIPKRWTGFGLTYRHGSSTYHIRVDNPRGVNRGVAEVRLDGAILPHMHVRLIDDGTSHEVVVTLLGG